VTLREEHRLRVFENKALRRIFGPKRDEVTGGCRKLHNEELRDLYSSPSIIRILNLGCLLPVARVISYDVGFNPSTAETCSYVLVYTNK
jgi:hypothetical protein